MFEGSSVRVGGGSGRGGGMYSYACLSRTCSMAIAIIKYCTDWQAYHGNMSAKVGSLRPVDSN